jgi:hypothetical protein
MYLLSEDGWFEPWPWDWLYWLRCVVGFYSPGKEMQEYYRDLIKKP